MLVVVIIFLFIAALWIEALWRLALAAIVWAPILFCGAAAMHWTASLRLPDPLAPLYAFIGAAIIARCVWALVGALRSETA